MGKWWNEFEVQIRNGTKVNRVAAARDGRRKVVRLLVRAQDTMLQFAQQWGQWIESFSGVIPEGTPVSDPEIASYARFFRIGAVMILLAEIGLAIWFARLWSALATPWAELFAVSLAMLLALGGDVAARLRYRNRTPGYSFRRIRSWAFIVAGCLVACLAGLLVTRFFAIGLFLFNVWVAGLSVCMPILCGLLLALAWAVSGGNRYAKRHAGAVAKYRVIRDMLDEVDKLLGSPNRMAREKLDEDGEVAEQAKSA